MPIRHLQPAPVWQWFADICAVPHPTYREQALAGLIAGRARDRGLSVRSDDKGNLYLSKPANGSGMADKAGVILQAHIDMVAQKTPESPHDFERDPIRPHIDGGWVCADDTTLGADNGIGAALALAVLFADDIPHPPLEVLLTVEEETGMGGVRAVRGDWLNGRYLINLDSEESGSIYLGCAGGRDAELHLPARREAVGSGLHARTIRISGLNGGHSGIDIHKGRGNALVLLADMLQRLDGHGGFRLAELTGGRLRNVIPREAEARVLVSAETAAALDGLAAAAQADARRQLGENGIRLAIRSETAEMPDTAFSAEDSRRMADLLSALPDGVLRMSSDFAGVVETSVCFSVAHTGSDGLTACLLMRSLLETPKDALSRRLAALARLSGAALRLDGDYPGWTPDPHAELYAAVRQVFRNRLGYEPRTEVMHAGLECGLMGERLPQVQMISFGPTIEGAHTPKERVNIAAVEECWLTLLDVLRHTPSGT